MARHLPYPSYFVLQLISLFIVPFFIIPFYKTMTLPLFIIPLVSILIIWIADLIVIFLSIYKWWNKVLIITEEGIISKGSKHLWLNVVNIIVKKRKSRYGAFAFVKFIYTDDSKITFEHSDLIEKDIYKFCKDKYFLAKYKGAMEQFIDS